MRTPRTIVAKHDATHELEARAIPTMFDGGCRHSRLASWPLFTSQAIFPGRGGVLLSQKAMMRWLAVFCRKARFVGRKIIASAENQTTGKGGAVVLPGHSPSRLGNSALEAFHQYRNNFTNRLHGSSLCKPVASVSGFVQRPAHSHSLIQINHVGHSSGGPFVAESNHAPEGFDECSKGFCTNEANQ